MPVKAIIEQLYRSTELDDCIARLVKQDHREDFKHELFIILYEKPSETLLALHRTGGLKFYVVRVAMNLARQTRNVFHKKYLSGIVTYDSDQIQNVSAQDECLESRLIDEKKEQDMISELDKVDDPDKFPYYKMLLEQVSKHKSMRETARATGIHVSTISRSIKKIREHLHERGYIFCLCFVGMGLHTWL